MEVAEKLDFRDFRGKDLSGWGYEYRRKMFIAACKYLGIHNTDVTNGVTIGFHSVMNSDYVNLTGDILDKVKRDSAIVNSERTIISNIKNDVRYKTRDFDEPGKFDTQLGGQRSRVEMWKQLLGFWHWTGQYSATWEVAFNELTWTIRTTQVILSFIFKYEWRDKDKLFV